MRESKHIDGTENHGGQAVALDWVTGRPVGDIAHTMRRKGYEKSSHQEADPAWCVEGRKRKPGWLECTQQRGVWYQINLGMTCQSFDLRLWAPRKHGLCLSWACTSGPQSLDIFLSLCTFSFSQPSLSIWTITFYLLYAKTTYHVLLPLEKFLLVIFPSEMISLCLEVYVVFTDGSCNQEWNTFRKEKPGVKRAAQRGFRK